MTVPTDAHRPPATPTDDGWAVVGDIDADVAPALAEILGRARPDIAGDLIVFDLSGVGFIDSSGLGVLIDARQRVADSGGTLMLRQPSHAVRRLLDITRLHGIFPTESVDGSSPTEFPVT